MTLYYIIGVYYMKNIDSVTTSKNNKTRANINFIVEQKTKPYYESAAFTGSKPKLYFKTHKKLILLNNIRGDKKNNCFEKTGFEYNYFPTKYNFSNIKKNLNNYGKEIKIFIKKRFKTDEIIIFDYTKRSNSLIEIKKNNEYREPAERAHVDYTNLSGSIRAKKIIGDKKYNLIVKNGGRIIQFNLWRPLSKFIYSSPLAFADARTIKNKNLIATDQFFPDRVGEIYHLSFSKKQKWFWVPEMQNNETILLKGWDSNEKEKIKYTPHTAFNLPERKEGFIPRESIEARIFAIFN